MTLPQPAAPARGTTPRLALKEWDVVVEALAQGRQALLVRKGGIDDPGRRFAVEGGRFWLMPTLFHERPVFLKPEHHGLLVPGAHRTPRSEAAVLPRGAGDHRPAIPGELTLRALAEVVDSVEAPTLDALQRLGERTVWTDRYLSLRFRWRSEDRPLVLVLRVHALDEPVHVPERPEYGGCRSWCELDDPPDARAARPVWDQGRVEAERDAVRRLLTAP